MLSLLNFTALVNNSIAAAQGAASALVDFTIGSALRAVMEANATIALWVQWLVIQVLAKTRLATSSGPDADSFVNDFGMTRLPAIAASGVVTFSRATTAYAAVIVAGAQVKTLDGTQTFTVTGGPYTIPIGTASLTNVSVQAVNPGTQGNVQAGTIGLLASAIAGVDYVTNPIAFTNGLNAESDTALRVRFNLFINSRAAGTDLAVQNAVASVQQGLTSVITENYPSPGFFTVTVDDGSGYPPSSLLSAVAAAINLVRPVGSVASIQPPTVYGVSVSVTLTLAPGASRAALDASVSAAVASFITGLPVGATLPMFKLAQTIGDVDPLNIINAIITLNGAGADIVSSATGVVRATSIAVA